MKIRKTLLSACAALAVGICGVSLWAGLQQNQAGLKPEKVSAESMAMTNSMLPQQQGKRKAPKKENGVQVRRFDYLSVGSLPSYWNDFGATFNDGVFTTTTEYSKYIVCNTVVKEDGYQYYAWQSPIGIPVHLNATITVSEDMVIRPMIVAYTGNGWPVAAYAELNLEAGVPTEVSLEYTFNQVYSIGFSFPPVEEYEEVYADIQISDIEFYYEYDAYVADTSESNKDIPGIGYNEDFIEDEDFEFYTLKIDDETTLGLYTDGYSDYLVGINSTASEITVPANYELNGTSRSLDTVGLGGWFDWSGAPNLTSLELPATVIEISIDNKPGSLTDLYYNGDGEIYFYSDTDYSDVYLHLRNDVSRRNYTGLGFKRVLLGEETPEYPEVEIADFFIKDDEGNYFGIKFTDNHMCVAEIVSENESITLPERFVYVNNVWNPIQFGYDVSWNSYYEGITLNRAQSVKNITIPAIYELMWLNCSAYNNLETLHFEGNVPSLNYYSSPWDYVIIYVNPKYLVNYEDNGWYVEADGEDTTEWITVNVEKEGEFGDVYLTENDYDLGKAVYLKVTGNIGQTDLSQMKSLTSLRKLDLSETTITTLPTSFLENHSSIKEVVLPATMQSISDAAFSYCHNLKFIDLGGATRIGASAFYECKKLSYVDISDVTFIDEIAFFECEKIDNIDFSNVETIGNNAFKYCYNLKSASANNLKTLGTYAFNNCTSLQTIDIPNVAIVSSSAFRGCSHLQSVNISGAIQIQERAFYECSSLNDIVFSENLTYIDQNAFYNCTNLCSLNLPNKLTTIGNYAFNYCTSLTEVNLPATLKTIGSGAFSKTGITTLRCKAAVPPTANYEFLSGIDVTRAVLYVPAFSRDFYRNTQYWSAFYMMRPLDEPLDYIYVDRPLTINLEEEDNDAVANSPKIELSYYYDNYSWSSNNTTGQLEAKGEGTLSAGHMQINALVSPSPTGTNYIPTLINHADKMRADSVSVSIRFNELNRWYALSLPFDVKVKDIEPGADTYWAIKYYDGSARAQGEAAWKDMTADDTMEAGKGYIVSVSTPNGSSSYYDSELGQYIYYYPTLTFHSGNSTTKNNIFRPNDVIVPLDENVAEFAHNRSWNLVGNPYPAYFDTHFLNDEFTAPITVWNGSKYSAFSPVDDNLVLMPYEAFFVQRPLDQEGITFKEEGRQAVYNASSNKVAAAASFVSADDRNVFNFHFATDEGTDRTRIVLNEEALAEYEMDRDASKFFGNEGVEAYVAGSGAMYAIDERPVGDGTATLAYRASAKTAVTISLDGRHSDEWDVILTDSMTGVSVNLANENYEFVTEAGDFADRFKVEFRRNSGMGIDDVIAGIGADGEVTVISIDGAVLFNGRLGDYKAEEGKVVIVKTSDRAIKTVF